MRVYDTDNTYHWLCRLLGHRWSRPLYPDSYLESWTRRKSCHRCVHILQGVAEVEARWRSNNAEAKAAGCKCGAPATHVRTARGTVGAVPAQLWSCAAHVNVNSWAKGSSGAWQPAGDFTPTDLEWVSAPQEY